jgi:tubulin polyglutamylase TTLL4
MKNHNFKEKLWIFKPSASSCGKGIKVMTRDTPLPEIKKGFVISEYISDPHLIQGLKYDLRIYVLVTSFDPLVIYMYDDGLVRFATEKYTLDEAHFEDSFVHLTNYSVQKKSETYTQNKSRTSTGLNSSKWSLRTLQKVFEDHDKDYDTVKKRMQDLIVKTMISVENPINTALHKGTKHKGNKNICYEIYGFDIIIDADLKPWILEVNISPSFSSSSPFDKNVKTKLICDTLTIVGVKPVDHEKYADEEEYIPRKLPHEEDKSDDEEGDQKMVKDILEGKKLPILIPFCREGMGCYLNHIGKIDKEDRKLLLDFEEEVSLSHNWKAETTFGVSINRF